MNEPGYNSNEAQDEKLMTESKRNINININEPLTSAAASPNKWRGEDSALTRGSLIVNVCPVKRRRTGIDPRYHSNGLWTWWHRTALTGLQI